jgi:hypothetical protein
MKARSIGVTFWGWVFITGGILGLLGAATPKEQIQLYGLGIFIVGGVMSALTFFCGLALLRLSEIARQLAIFICFCSILMIPIYLRPIMNELKSDEFWKKQKELILQKKIHEDKNVILANFAKIEEAGRRGELDFILFLLAAPFAVIELIPVYFFTRPKVKKQFFEDEPDVEAESSEN